MEPQAESPTEAPPQLVKRIHELYEELGREDVRAVEDWEKWRGAIRQEHSAK